jgi:PAS domain S-box-containing protein
MSALTGQTREQLSASTAVDLVDPLDHDTVRAMVERALQSPGVPVGREIRLLGARWARMHVIRLRDQDTPHPLLTQIIDVSEQRGLEVELRHQAEHDR